MVKQSLVKIVLGVPVKDRVARVDADLEQLISGQTPLPLSLLSDSAFLRAVALMPLFLAALSAILAQYGAERHEARGPPQALRCALASSKHTEPRAGSKVCWPQTQRESRECEPWVRSQTRKNVLVQRISLESPQK